MIMLNKNISKCAWDRFEPGTFNIDSRHRIIGLLRYSIPICVGQLYLTQIAQKEALHKRLFSAAFKHRIFS